jgi:hypothetical protein
MGLAGLAALLVPGTRRRPAQSAAAAEPRRVRPAAAQA